MSHRFVNEMCNKLTREKLSQFSAEQTWLATETRTHDIVVAVVVVVTFVSHFPVL